MTKNEIQLPSHDQYEFCLVPRRRFAVGGTIFVVFVLAFTVVALLIPKYCGLMVLYGLAACLRVFIWEPISLQHKSQHRVALVAVSLAFFVPISNTWAPRIWRDLVLSLPRHPWISFAMPEVFTALVCGCAVLVLGNRYQLKPVRIHWLLILAGLFLVSGAGVSAAGSRYPGQAIGGSVAGILAPLCVFLVMAAFHDNLSFCGEVLKSIAAASLVPLALGISSVLRTFGIPVRLLDFYWIKMNIHIFGDYGASTFGNSGHMASLILLVIPVYSALLSDPDAKRRVRLLGGIGLIACFYNSLFTYSRSALLIGFPIFILLSVRTFRLQLPSRWVHAFASILLIIVLCDSVTVTSFFNLYRSLSERNSNSFQNSSQPGTQPATGNEMGVGAAREDSMKGQGYINPSVSTPSIPSVATGRQQLEPPNQISESQAGTPNPGPASPDPLMREAAPGNGTLSAASGPTAPSSATSLLATPPTVEEKLKSLGNGSVSGREPSSRDTFVDGVFKIAGREQKTARQPNLLITQVLRPRSISDLGVSDLSGEYRFDSIRRGLFLARVYAVRGAGLGTYHILDPRYTSPHSLFLQILVEGGILTFLGFLLVTIYVSLRAGALLLRAILSGNSERGASPAVAGATASVSFLACGALAGGSLILEGFTVWGFLLAYCVALSTCPLPGRSELPFYCPSAGR